jgi:hypothetical protein
MRRGAARVNSKGRGKMAADALSGSRRLVVGVVLVRRLDLAAHHQRAGHMAARLELHFVRRLRREPGAAHDPDLAAAQASWGMSSSRRTGRFTSGACMNCSSLRGVHARCAGWVDDSMGMVIPSAARKSWPEHVIPECLSLHAPSSAGECVRARRRRPMGRCR